MPRAPFRSADVLPYLIQQESHGHAGVQGPVTKWGRAQGETQVLPGTGAAMAKKIGVAWRPDLMTGTSPEAATYQRAIGGAYLDEALDATGNVTDALKYYHGGPSRSMWGPKTNAYAANVLRRMGVE